MKRVVLLVPYEFYQEMEIYVIPERYANIPYLISQDSDLLKDEEALKKTPKTIFVPKPNDGE